MASSSIISARAAMAFSTAFSSVSLNTSMTILATNTTSRYGLRYCPFVASVLLILVDKIFHSMFLRPVPTHKIQ